jgi:glycosyltransferase involved in cell wall biosynthesis
MSIAVRKRQLVKPSLCLIRQEAFPGDTRAMKQTEALTREGWEVTVIAARAPGQAFTDEWRGINILRIPLRHSNSNAIQMALEYVVFWLCALMAVTALHIPRRFIAVQVNTMPDFLVFATYPVKLMGASVVLDLQELMPEMLQELFHVDSSHPFVRLLKKIERLAVLYSDETITVNETTYRLLLERRIPSDRLTIVHNVPDENYVQATSYSPRKESRSAPVLFYHGSILPRYGVPFLVSAVGILRRILPEVKLVIAGDGADMGSVRKAVKELELEANTELLGRVPHERIRELILRSDICVAPLKKTLYTEIMLPIKLFEWAACSKPIVAPMLTTIWDFYGDDSVAYFRPEDPEDLALTILSLWHDEARRKTLARNVHRRFEAVRWSRHQSVYTDVFRRVARRTPAKVTSATPKSSTTIS